MPPPTKKTTADQTTLNKLILKDSADKSVLNTWFQQWTTDSRAPISSTTTTSLIPDEEEESFSASEEDSGLGFHTSKTDTDLDRQNLSANEKLRRQMLGKNASRLSKQSSSRFNAGLTASKPMPEQLRKAREVVSDDDETEGRTSAAVTGKKSRKGKDSRLVVPPSMGTDGPGIATTNAPSHDEVSTNTVIPVVKPSSKKRPASYLDEMLAKRNAKKNKMPPQQPKKQKKSDVEND